MDETQHLIANKGDKVEILHWEDSNYGKFELLQTLSNANLFSAKKWNDQYFLATAYLENVTIYK